MPPEYLVLHPAFWVWKENESWLENDDGAKALNDKEIVFVQKKGRKSKRTKYHQKLQHVDERVQMETGENVERSFVEFWLDDSPFYEPVVQVDRSLRLHEIQDSIVELCKSLKNECDF